jgi:hypothetical protein
MRYSLESRARIVSLMRQRARRRQLLPVVRVGPGIGSGALRAPPATAPALRRSGGGDLAGAHKLKAGSLVLAAVLERPPSTVGKVLPCAGCSRLPRARRDRRVRYEREHPGDLVHVDTKKLGGFWEIGNRIPRDGVRRSRRAGWQCLHVAIDVDRPRFGGQRLVRRLLSLSSSRSRPATGSRASSGV